MNYNKSETKFNIVVSKEHEKRLIISPIIPIRIHVCVYLHLYNYISIVPRAFDHFLLTNFQAIMDIVSYAMKY